VLPSDIPLFIESEVPAPVEPPALTDDDPLFEFQAVSSESLMEPSLLLSILPKRLVSDMPLALSSVEFREPLRSVSRVEKLRAWELLSDPLLLEEISAKAGTERAKEKRARGSAMRFMGTHSPVILWLVVPRTKYGDHSSRKELFLKKEPGEITSGGAMKIIAPYLQRHLIASQVLSDPGDLNNLK
jgi:hypothetical protein